MVVSLEDLSLDDVDGMTALVVANRIDIERVDPPRPPEWFTEAGQRARVERILHGTASGEIRCWTIRVADRLAGDIAITGIARGPFQSGHLGYLVDRAHRGRGVATAAVGLALHAAFEELGLHRLDAGTLTTNSASQRVLEKCGFRRVGVVERYLFIAGAWRDNFLYERIGPDRDPPV